MLTYKEFSMLIRAKARLIHPNRRSGSNLVCPASMQCTATSAKRPILVSSPHTKLMTALLLFIPGYNFLPVNTHVCTVTIEHTCIIHPKRNFIYPPAYVMLNVTANQN